MRRRIFNAGNSLVISLPADCVREHGLRAGFDVDVQPSSGGGLHISPASAAPVISPEFARQVDDFIREHRSILEELAAR